MGLYILADVKMPIWPASMCGKHANKWTFGNVWPFHDWVWKGRGIDQLSRVWLSNFYSWTFYIPIIKPRHHSALLLCPLQFCLLDGLFDLLCGPEEGYLLLLFLQTIDLLLILTVLRSCLSFRFWGSFLIQESDPQLVWYHEHPEIFDKINVISIDTPSWAPPKL